MVVDVPVIGGEKTHGSNLRGSSLSVLETIAPAETVPAPITEDDDPDVAHVFWPDEEEAARRTGNRCTTLCDKFIYVPVVKPPTVCPACMEIGRILMSEATQRQRLRDRSRTRPDNT